MEWGGVVVRRCGGNTDLCDVILSAKLLIGSSVYTRFIAHFIIVIFGSLRTEELLAAIVFQQSAT